ncbi:MAG TPA: DegT/DnrJ/EryC1/StrS family aminotransferase [Anaerolineales bacterium]|nr:DegT/DnrJ/EryC1/StrS family aminotransferase [Anaerolineales bacterium]
MTTSFSPIPMSSPDLTEAEREAVLAVLHTPNLSMGQEILAFEKAICDYTGAKHALGVNSGTAGLHLCVHAAGIRDGDWVLTTPFSFVASTNVILFERATPIFVDVDPQTGNMDIQKMREAVRELCAGGASARRWLPRQGVIGEAPRLKAILPVDVFGQPADLDPIVALAQEYGLKVIEDSCEAIGATYKGRPAGRLGDYGVFAFYPNKQMTVGEGGVIVTDDDDAAAIMRALRNQGRAPGDTWLQHTHLGYNYRLDEMSAALGRVQVSRLDSLLDKREKVAFWYEERLREIPGVEIPVVLPDTTRMSWFVYVVRFAPGIDREWVSKELKKRGIPNRPYFIPIHLQPYVANQFGYREGDFPVTEDLGRRGLALPFSGVMPEQDVARVCEAIREILS